MKNNIEEILSKIKALEKELSEEIQKKEEEFFYNIQGKKVLFANSVRQKHKLLMTRLYVYIFNASLLNILTAPVIWSCLAPALFLDLVVSVYQMICFPVYGIPKVQREDYIVVDRQALGYLNLLEKLNCVYCGYFNGLISYVQEIAARTEQYWCPIKHARKVSAMHSRYMKFVEYGDSDGYKRKLEELRSGFDDLKGSDG